MWSRGSSRSCSGVSSMMPPVWLASMASPAPGMAARYDARYGVMLDTLFTYLDAHHISGNYWEAGPYGDINSVSPQGGQDAPQMSDFDPPSRHPSVKEQTSMKRACARQEPCSRCSCAGLPSSARHWPCKLRRHGLQSTTATASSPR